MVIDRIDTTNSGYFENVPMVALVDEGTASAAEILAGALKDRRRCSLVGTRTFGKGTVQTIMDLPGGAGLRLTAMRYYTPAGSGIQASGVLPTETVSDSEPDQTEFTRESDLPNHLPSEQSVSLSKSTRTNLDELPSAQPCENPKPLVTLSERIRRLPASPTDKDSKILARGYQLLLAHL
jgi:carboxyl-terminal processing protease